MPSEDPAELAAAVLEVDSSGCVKAMPSSGGVMGGKSTGRGRGGVVSGDLGF